MNSGIEMGPSNHVHITSDEFHDHDLVHDEEEAGSCDGDEEEGSGDVEHDYELGPGINDLILQNHEVGYQDHDGNYAMGHDNQGDQGRDGISKAGQRNAEFIT